MVVHHKSFLTTFCGQKTWIFRPEKGDDTITPLVKDFDASFNGEIMFFYYLIYLVCMVSIYSMVPFLGGDTLTPYGVMKFYAVLNIVFLFTVVWWNARKNFYFVWGSYLIAIAGYFGFIYPYASNILLIVVFCVAGLNVSITFYDVVVCRCKGIYQRTWKRYSIQFKQKER